MVLYLNNDDEIFLGKCSFNDVRTVPKEQGAVLFVGWPAYREKNRES
jgi:hypothetical protein